MGCLLLLLSNFLKKERTSNGGRSFLIVLKEDERYFRGSS